MTEKKGLEEGQGGSPQPWTILPRGVIGIGPAEKLGGQSRAGPSPVNRIQAAQGLWEPRAVYLQPYNYPHSACRRGCAGLPSLLWGLVPHSTKECWGPESIQQVVPRHAFLHLL